MQQSSPIRIVLALAVGLLFLLSLVILLLITDLGFNLWEHFQQTPFWFNLAYATGLALISLLMGWLIWRLLWKSGSEVNPTQKPSPEPIDEETLQQRVAQAETRGVDTSDVHAELDRLRQQKQAGVVRLALFGEVSSGKSSLIKGLIPGLELETDVLGGTTQTIDAYHWRSSAGDMLELLDMPGLNEAGGNLDQGVREEALRAHIIIYVCDGDLTRDQHLELDGLRELNKPLILALNKTDRFNQEQISQLKERLGSYVEQLVAIRSGGEQEMIRVLPDGSEERVIRQRQPQLDELRMAIQRFIDGDQELLEQLRDSAVFVLVQRKLEQAVHEHANQQASKTVRDYSRKAVVGAMAAVTPGSDLIIQGYLGTQMIKELSALYEVPVRKMDSELLMELAQKHLGKTHTLVLALAGNGLKAFPGIGTLAGGVVHAVAYGLIFDSLGRAIATSLASRGELHPVQTVSLFKETLGEDLEKTAKRLAEIALAETDSTTRE